MNIYYTRFKSPFCEVILAGNEDGLTNLHLQTGEGKRTLEIAESWIRNDEIFTEAINQLREYFAGQRTSFDLVLNPKGTDFQKRVWAELCRIPYGTTVSYRLVADKIGKPEACRAVGTANAKNPIPLIVPCHRVVRADGKLSGFAHGVDMKRKLIDFESSISGIDTKG